MGTVRLEIDVDGNSLAESVAELISTVELNAGQRKKILEQFDDHEICARLMSGESYVELEVEQIVEICAHHDLNIIDPETIRDQQYEEVFGELKEKFSVAELEAICNSK